MFLGLLTLITALTISAVAIYYSVAGLVAIFAAAAIPIMIMGSVLEIAKLVTAVWLHRYWKQAAWWLKTYLSVAVVVLMFITSMGIFGFLSKAHIEQTATATEGLAQIERIDAELARQQTVIVRAEERIADASSSVGNNNDAIQAQIDKEQERIDTAYNRIQPAIDEQLAIIAKAEVDLQARIQPLLDQAATIENTLSNLSTALADNKVRIAQGIVGAEQDGALGPDTSAKIQAYRIAEEATRTELLAQVEQIRTSPQPVVTASRIEISRIRANADAQIAQSNQLIQTLRESISVGKDTSVEEAVLQQQQKIVEANNTIDTLTQQKYQYQAEYRKLEAEVGPIKYLAEFVYGETANADLLEEAVRWVIVLIIFVFDPLAVLLLIASQTTFEMRREAKLKAQQEEEDAAQQERLRLSNDEYNQKVEEIIKRSTTESKELNNEQIANRSDVQQSDNSKGGKDDLARDSDSSSASSTVDSVQTELNTTGAGHNGGNTSDRMDAVEESRQQELEIKEQDESYKNAKQTWKSDHPDQTVKMWKDLYIKGKVDALPWDSDTYIQNSEQDTESLWQKLRSKDE